MSLHVHYKGQVRYAREIAQISLDMTIEHHNRPGWIKAIKSKIDSGNFKKDLGWLEKEGAEVPDGFRTEVAKEYSELFYEALNDGRIPNPNEDPVLNPGPIEGIDPKAAMVPDPNKSEVLKGGSIIVDPHLGVIEK